MASSVSPSFDQPNDGLVPLVIGITGHRDLREQDIPALETAVRNIIREQQAAYPNTPLIMLSPLGEGADRLAARVALEEKVQLYVPLPLPVELYELDFTEPGSKAEFDSLLQQATRVFTLPWLYCDTRSTECETNLSAEEASGHRAEQYAQLGAYLARHTHFLIALWDGDNLQSNELVGGTAQVVRFRLEGAPPPYGPERSALEAGGYGGVLHLQTPRVSKPNSGGEAGTLNVLTPRGDSTDSEEHYRRLDIFNRDVTAHKSSLGSTALRNVGFLLGEDSGVAVPTMDSKPSPEPGPWAPLSIFAWSDTLSSQFAGHMNRTVRRIFMMVFIAALSFNLFHSLPHGDHGSGHGGGHGEAGGHGATAAHGDSHGGVAMAAESHGDTAHPTDAGHSTSSDGHGAAPATKPADGHGTDHGSKPTGGQGDGHSAPTGQGSTADNSHGTVASTKAGTTQADLTGDILGAIPWFLWFYLVVVAVNFLMHRQAVQQEYQNKYQDYRALAEGLRVQTFWRLGGLRDAANDHYLGKQRGELAWIQNAIKGFNVLADGNNFLSAQSGVGDLPLVMRQWVREQRHYYIHKVEREEAGLERSEKLIGGLLLSSIALALLLAPTLSVPSTFPILSTFKHWVEQPYPHGFFMILVVMLAVSAGLVHAYNQHFARAEHIKRFSRMSTLFDSAARRIDDLLKENRGGEVREILRELGREALSENGDWVLLHRERPLEVPHAG